MKPGAWVFLILFVVVPVALCNQVVARQGDPSEAETQEFKSPMILDLPLKDFRTIPWNTGKHFNELHKYYCDDLVISEFLMSKKEDSRHGKAAGMRLDMQGAVTVRPSYDRLATLRFDVIKGEERLAATQVGIKAGEGKTRQFSTELTLDAPTRSRASSPQGRTLCYASP
jgi:hypothetical protein